MFEHAHESVALRMPRQGLRELVSSMDSDLQRLALFPGVVGLMGAIDTLARRGSAIDLGPVQRAVASRRAEYAAGRVLAREALACIGIDAHDIGVAANGAPAWSRGAVGSISHAMGLVVVAVSHSDRYGGIGLDVEGVGRLTNTPLDSLFTAKELGRFQALDLTLLFSAKEALYKLLNPALDRYIDHLEIEVQMASAPGEFWAHSNSQADLAGLLQRVRGRYFEWAGCWVTCAVLAAA